MQKAHATLKYDPRHRNVLRHEVLVPRYGLCQDMLASYQDTLSQCTTRCVTTPNRNACIRYIYYAKAVGKYVIHWITSLTACATSSTLHYIAVPLQACTLHPRTWDCTHQKTQWLHCRQERTYVQRITQGITRRYIAYDPDTHLRERASRNHLRCPAPPRAGHQRAQLEKLELNAPGTVSWSQRNVAYASATRQSVESVSARTRHAPRVSHSSRNASLLVAVVSCLV